VQVHKCESASEWGSEPRAARVKAASWAMESEIVGEVQVHECESVRGRGSEPRTAQ
jgi:hypothetical protein